MEKTVVVFLGWLKTDRPVATTEHAGFEWIPWSPPHRLQKKTIDPLLAEVERFFAGRGSPDEVR